MNVERQVSGIDVSDLLLFVRSIFRLFIAVPLMAVATTLLTYRRLNSKISIMN